MTILVTFCAWAKLHDLLGDVVADEGDGLRPELLGQLHVGHEACCAAARSGCGCGWSRRSRRSSGRWSRLAMRRDIRITRAEVGLGPTQTSSVSEILQVCSRAPVASRASSRWACDAVGGAAQGQLAQGDQVARRKKFSHGPRRLVGHVDLALAAGARSRSSGGRSTSSTSSASSKTVSGTVSRTCTPVICGTMSLRLSRCWTLSVV